MPMKSNEAATVNKERWKKMEMTPTSLVIHCELEMAYRVVHRTTHTLSVDRPIWYIIQDNSKQNRLTWKNTAEKR